MVVVKVEVVKKCWNDRSLTCAIRVQRVQDRWNGLHTHAPHNR